MILEERLPRVRELARGIVGAEHPFERRERFGALFEQRLDARVRLLDVHPRGEDSRKEVRVLLTAAEFAVDGFECGSNAIAVDGGSDGIHIRWQRRMTNRTA